MDLIQVGKAVFGKEITLPWESNPGPSPIRGGPVTILAFIVCLFLAEDPFKSSNISFDKIEPSQQRLGCKNWGTPGIEQRWIWEKTMQKRILRKVQQQSAKKRKESPERVRTMLVLPHTAMYTMMHTAMYMVQYFLACDSTDTCCPVPPCILHHHFRSSLASGRCIYSFLETVFVMKKAAPGTSWMKTQPLW